MSFLWKYASGGLAVLCLVLFVMLQGERIHSGKLQERVTYFRSELVRISDEQDKQKAETERRIAEAKAKVRVVEKVVTRLENRPLPDQCQTPDLEAWRGVL